MRTYSLVVAFVLTLSFGATSVAAESSPVEDLLTRFGLLPPPPVEPTEDPPVEDLPVPDVQPEEDTVLPDFLSDALVVASAPVALVSRTLVDLGLMLASGLFEGFEGGSDTVKDAAASVTYHPIESGIIAAFSIALAGLAGGLGYLAQRYGGFGGIPLYTRIAKSDLLENQLRGQIFELIKNNPGINVSEVARRLDIAWGTATHHLHKLRHEKMVSIRIASNQKCYFPNGGTYTPHEMDVMSATKHPTAKQIAEFLVKTGAKSHGDIAHALGLSPALVSFHAKKLVDQGVVARHRDGRNTIFTPLEPNLEPTPRPGVH